MKTKYKNTYAALLIGSVIASSSANAALVNVNFNGFIPTTAPVPTESSLTGVGGLGLNTSWNQYAAVDSSGTMVDSSGANTTMTVDTDFTEGRSHTANISIFESSLQGSGGGGRGSTYTTTIAGLDNGGLYDIWVYSYADGTGREGSLADWATTNTTTTVGTQEIDSLAGGAGDTFTYGTNYVLFENVEATAGGVIVVTGTGRVTTGTDRRAVLSGLQIQSVPEPSTTALLGLGGLALILRRRK